MRNVLPSLLITFALLSSATPAFGFFSEIWDYVKQYQFGIDYTSSYDSVRATYDTEASGAATTGCVLTEDDPTKQTCSVTMKGGGSSGFGVFLQQAFKRQGTFYFKPDLGLGARYLEGRMSEDEIARSKQSGLPLKDMRFSLGSLILKPYVTLGITPQSKWPDLLLSLGPVAQVGMGKVRVNDESESVVVATSSGSFVTGFVQLELVFWRFGDGALSVFFANDYSGDGKGTRFYPKDVDGMSNIRANFSRSVGGGFFGLGAKLVLDYP